MFQGGLKNFHERQNEFLKKQMEKKQEISNKYGEQAQCTFKPEINLTSAIIMENDPQRGTEKRDAKINRLYFQDAQKKEVIRELKEQEVYGEMTFQPRINQTSRAIVDEYKNQDGSTVRVSAKHKFQARQEQYKKEQEEELTFQPQTHSKNTRLYESVPGVVLNDGDPTVNQNRIRAKLKEKHQRIAMERRQREMKELDECTFHPKTNPCVQDNNQEVVIVKGLGRHLELQELRKK